MSEDISLKQTVTPNYSVGQDYVKTNSMEQYLPVLAVSHLSEYRQYRQTVEPRCFDESLLSYTECVSNTVAGEQFMCLTTHIIFREISPWVREQKLGLSEVSLGWWEEGRCVSWHHGASAQSHSVYTDDGDAACTPKRQRHLETSPIHTQRTVTRQTTHVTSICRSELPPTWLRGKQPTTMIFFYYKDIMFSLSVSHLEMVNMLLCIQVYASSSLFYGHDRQANIYTAMQLSFLNLTQRWRIRPILEKCLVNQYNIKFLHHCTYIYGGLGILQDPIIQNKESLQ